MNFGAESEVVSSARPPGRLPISVNRARDSEQANRENYKW